MLTESQIDDVWEGQIAAETRSLYFGDFASLFSTRKQWITGLSFFLSSGAAATLIGKLPIWFPIVLSTAVAVITAYAVAVNLDSKIRTMAKLHYAWSAVGRDYARLWNHVYSEEAEGELEDLQRRELELSELATTDAPNDPERLSRWQDQVFRLHRLEIA
jgi:hypothetical protein